jgi:uncharacterized protein YhaN
MSKKNGIGNVPASDLVTSSPHPKINSDRVGMLKAISERIIKAKIVLGEADFQVAVAENQRIAARQGLQQALAALDQFANTEAQVLGLAADGKWNFNADTLEFTRLP